MHCPKCYSADCQSNHISEDTMKHALHAGHAAHRAGLHIGGWLGLAAAGAMKGVNALREKWRCNNCGNRFSEGS